ncbi:amino acid permease F13H10.3-like protein [Leptotrombidium deliense]|uniref:Amino acid permease F13H10.3-like protein n=1 Tax=Leptotrombidium deliense TaxID=299467 RepID=A0A443SHK9_9ACAR|nr:amino acid permease F13H10.3-like protein [Leptotrombidium deliense]
MSARLDRVVREPRSLTTSMDSNSLSRSIRKPFHYPVNKQFIGHPALDKNSIEHSANYKRYLYYSKLTANNPEAMRIPEHVVPYHFLIAQIPFRHTDADGKQGSILTIFAVWNMLMGTSLLCLPWALHKAGFALGSIIMLAMLYVCFYTADLIVKIPKLINASCNEFGDACYLIFGRWAQIVCIFSSLVTLIGTCVVYWILMSNFLFNVVDYVYDFETSNQSFVIRVNGNEDVFCEQKAQSVNISKSIVEEENFFHTYWHPTQTVPFILAFFVAPVLLIKSPTVFMKCNAIGTLSVIYLLAFVIFKAGKWGFFNINFNDKSSVNYAPLFSSKFAIQTGILSQALFVHNCILTALKLNRNPENNSRDMAIAYILVGFTYFIIAVAIYVAFPLFKECLKDNFLDNFQSSDITAFITRIFLFIQIFCLYPLFAYMLRAQIFNVLFPKNPEPKFIRRLLFALTLSVACIAVAVNFPSIGTIIRFSGSFAGLVLVFTLPPLAYTKAVRQNKCKDDSKNRVSIIRHIFHAFIIIFGILNCVFQFTVSD